MSQEKGGQVRGGREQAARLTGFVQEGRGSWGGESGAGRAGRRAGETAELLGGRTREAVLMHRAQGLGSRKTQDLPTGLGTTGLEEGGSGRSYG